jgi:hypothetical protein
MNRSVSTEDDRGLTSYINSTFVVLAVDGKIVWFVELQLVVVQDSRDGRRVKQ